MTAMAERPAMQMAWYNYRTDQYDYFEGAPSDFTDYVPQDRSAQAIYRLYTKDMGLAPIQAAKRTLLACVGETEQEAEK